MALASLSTGRQDCSECYHRGDSSVKVPITRPPLFQDLVSRLATVYASS